jgi:hypothetical protein
MKNLKDDVEETDVVSFKVSACQLPQDSRSRN